jgi:sarcosine oxidase subunit beta
MTQQVRADVVVIGGGATGASAAWHLAEAGITDVLILERDVLASGSTSKAAGGIRLQFADELNIRLMLRAMAAYEQFEDRFGADIGFRQPGYLFLVGPEDSERFDAALDTQHALGVDTQRLTIDAARAMVPQIDPEGLSYATFNPREGYATPEAVVQAYASAAHARGVRIQQGCEVTGIETAAGRIAGVVTTKGTVLTDRVVCAAGVDSAAVGSMVGLDIPVRPEPHWIHYSPGDCGFPRDMPLTIDFATGFYMHREGTGLLLGGRERMLDDFAVTATARFPALENLGVQSSWWGNYEMSPDHNAIVGHAGEPEGFYYATGFSGHGFQQSPAIGEHVAERIAGLTPSLDLSALSLERFANGKRREEAFVV